MRIVVIAALLVLSTLPASAKPVSIEFLNGPLDPRTIGRLSGLACRNYDKIVHVDIAVDWPAATADAEKSGFERLVFWTDDAEYLFPKGSYFFLHGDWIVKGYFIVRSGGVHQGMVSNAFEKVDDAAVMLNPNVVETKARGSNC
jgi:hypothetical protein